jgi:hypothetical protein
LLLYEVAGSKLLGATINSTWSGGAARNWSVAGNWNPLGVPSNGADLYNVHIPTPSAVTVDGTFAIETFDLDSGALANMPAGFLTLNTNSILDGILRMGADGNFATARLALGAAVAVFGTGTIDLLANTSIEGPVSEVVIGSGITVQTGQWPNGGPTIMANLTVAGRLNINNPNFFVQAGRMLTAPAHCISPRMRNSPHSARW